MEDLFRSYWWLIFPVGYFLYSAFQSWLNYRRHRDTLDLIKSYAAQGREPPADLLAELNRPIDAEEADRGDRLSRRYRRREHGWYQVVLFGVLASGFGFASFTDIYGAGEAFVIVTFVMAALCLASLVAVLTRRPD